MLLKYIWKSKIPLRSKTFRKNKLQLLVLPDVKKHNPTINTMVYNWCKDRQVNHGRKKPRNKLLTHMGHLLHIQRWIYETMGKRFFNRVLAQLDIQVS